MYKWIILAGLMLIIIVTITIHAVLNEEKEDMIKLGSDTWYYKYEVNGGLCISTTAPIKDNEEARNWYHPEKGYRCLGGFYVADPEASSNIGEFYNYD